MLRSTSIVRARAVNWQVDYIASVPALEHASVLAPPQAGTAAAIGADNELLRAEAALHISFLHENQPGSAGL